MTTLSPISTTPHFLWLDLTRSCQLKCVHCYNASGPDGDHGTMNRENWISVLDQAAACGVRGVQFIGGEPTMHPDFGDLVDHALNIGLKAEIYSNLVHVTGESWELFQREGISLATSYYSDRAEEHNAMTGRRSHARTRANIDKAVRLGIPLRVGVIATDESRASEAERDLEALGVTRIGVDHMRPFGRGAQGQAPDPAGLCGRCGSGKAAIAPDGSVSPCVFSSWMAVGNVQDAPLAAILDGAAMAEANAIIRNVVRKGGSRPEQKCNPRKCSPDQNCYPNQTPCYPAQNPCTPQGHVPPACNPDDQECRPGTPSTFCNPRR